MRKLRSGDEVIVIAGKEKGRRGNILRFLPKSERVVVQGVNLVTKHKKPDRQNPQGGLIKQEASIHVSNVMFADPRTGEPTRIQIKILESGRKVRVAVKSGEQIDK